MDISVIIPNYKRVFELKRCISSVLKQSFKGNVEIIVVDDFSPNVKTIVSELKSLIVPDNFTLKTIFHSENRNASAARNTGISIACGKFVGLLDSDDEWPIDYLQSQYNFHHHLNDNLFSYSFIKNITANGSWLKPDFSFKPTKISIGEYIFLRKQSLQTSGIFGKLECFQQNLFNENLKSFQDYSFCINAVHNGYSFILNKSVTVNRYISLKEDLDHVGRKVDSKYLDFWLKVHFDKMNPNAIAAYKVRNINFYDLSFWVYIKTLFTECNRVTYPLVIESIVKRCFSKIYKFTFFIKLRILVKNLF